MTTLSAQFSRISRIQRKFQNLILLYATGKLSTAQVISIIERRSGFDKWGPSPLVRRKITALTTATRDSMKSRGYAARVLFETAKLRQRLDVANATIAHLRRVEGMYKTVAMSDDARSMRGVQAFVNMFQDIGFEYPETTQPGQSATTLILGGKPAGEAIATLINLSEPAHSARNFQYLLPFLSRPSPFPLPWPKDMAALRVVDVGSQVLDFEGDMHAPLQAAAPIETIGFDPFATPSEAPGGVIDVHRDDNRVIRTYPCLLGDGGRVRFHINRYDATSSILPTNHALTRPFGLLDQALETVETRELQSHRIDDVLADLGAVDLLKVDVQGAAHTVLANGPALLRRTLVCHVEVEFAPVYKGQRLFADVDGLLREAGFGFVDFFSLGRQRYASFDTARDRAFHRGRTLWADGVYVRGLDQPDTLTASELFRTALIMHVCYNKQDLAAELLRHADQRAGTQSSSAYIAGLLTGSAA